MKDQQLLANFLNKLMQKSNELFHKLTLYSSVSVIAYYSVSNIAP